MEMVQCSVCGKTFSEDAIIRMGDYRVCSDCKPVFLQRLREGANLTGAMTYGGFWIRVVAAFIDGLVMFAGGWMLIFLVGLLFGAVGMNAIVARIVNQAIGYVFYIAYVTYFLGAYGATLGKMVFGLKVVRPNGAKITYGRAFGRYWANMLSSLTVFSGYIMAGFDAEKRTLHDRICDTRVIRV